MLLQAGQRGTGRGDVYTYRPQGVKRINPEEQIRSRLRELTRETRRVREELEEMIRREPSGYERQESAPGRQPAMEPARTRRRRIKHRS